MRTSKLHLIAAGRYHDIDFAKLELLNLLAATAEVTQGLRDFRIADELYLDRRTAPLDVLLHTSFCGQRPEFRDAD